MAGTQHRVRCAALEGGLHPVHCRDAVGRSAGRLSSRSNPRGLRRTTRDEDEENEACHARTTRITTKAVGREPARHTSTEPHSGEINDMSSPEQQLQHIESQIELTKRLQI